MKDFEFEIVLKEVPDEWIVTEQVNWYQFRIGEHINAETLKKLLDSPRWKVTIR